MFAKTTDKTAWKIISDPVAEERKWLAAAEVVRDQSMPSCIARTAAGERLSDGTHAWASSIVASFAAMGVFFIAFAMFTSATAILNINDELTTFSDWLSAVFWMIGIPIAGCSIAGYLQRPHAKERAWAWTVPMIPYVAIGLFGFHYRIGLPWAMMVLLTGVLCARGSYMLGRMFAAWWQTHLPRMRVARATLPLLGGISVMVWALIAQIVTGNGNHDPHTQMAASTGWTGMYLLAALTSLFATLSSWACGSKQLSTSLAAAFTPQMPLILLYASSVLASAVYTVGSAFMKTADPAALIVSTVALVTTTVCTICGGSFGWAIRRCDR